MGSSITTMCVRIGRHPSPPTPLIGSSQQIQDVKDKLEDLISRVDKLKVSLTKVDTKDHRVEVERRTQLAKFVLQLHYPAR